MRHAHIIRVLALAAACAVHAQYIPELGMYVDLAPETEILRRARLARQNNDRSEMPFLEAAARSEDADRTERSRAAETYIKLATLDESVGFMREFYSITESFGWAYSAYQRFLEKAAAEEKDADETVRERLYAFLLEIVQTCKSASDANRANLFLLERVPGYADSRQRAALTRYANTGNDWVTNTFNPIKEHFDTLPPSKLVDLRTRFPTLPPPPGETPSPSPRIWPYAATLAALAIAIAIILRKAIK